MKKYFIRTFGCQMNVHDSEKMAGVLRAQGYEEAEGQGEADLVILNTCSVRQKAEQKFLSDLGRLKGLKKARPGVKIAVAGCIAKQMGGKILKRTPHVDYVLGPQNIGALAGALKAGQAVEVGENPDLATADLPVVRKEKGRAWVTIMYGCDNYCSYCIVPYTRGREKSRPAGNILAEIEGLAREGCAEVTLLGQNVNSYRGECDFGELLNKINKVHSIRRVRFVTSHPRDLTDGLMEAIGGLKKVCEHIHLPMQSGSDRVLGLMKRGYTYAEYLEKVTRLRARVPGIAITTDIIAGFPGETPDDHRATLEAIGEIRFDGLFAFMYSKRPMTAAARMEGQLGEATRLERLKEILALQDGITLEKNEALVGSTQEVLVEGPSETDPQKLTGRTRTNKIVNFTADGPEGDIGAGDIVRVRISAARMHSLEGEAEGAQMGQG